MINDEIIMSYFELTYKITKKEYWIRKTRHEFYQQTMSSYGTSDGMKVFSQGFPVDRNVIQLVDTEADAFKEIEMLKYKRRHFSKYMKQLSSADRYFLIRKYKWREDCLNEQLERECYEELLEIEEAVSYQFEGYMPHIQQEEIEEVTSEKYAENLENSFEQMMNLLGVNAT